MSAIVCVACGADRTGDGTRREVRDDAHLHGWTSVFDAFDLAIADLCPDHPRATS